MMNEDADEPTDVDEFILQRRLITLGHKLTERRNNDLRAHGLTAGQYDALSFFADHPGGVVQDLGTYLHVTHQAAQKVVMRMRHQGILSMKISLTDARRHQLYLTQSGQKLLHELRRNGTTAGQELLEVLSPEQRRQLASTVDTLLSRCERKQCRNSHHQSHNT